MPKEELLTKPSIAMPSLKHRYTGQEYLKVTYWLLNYKDVFSMNYLYLLMHEWMIEEGYCTRADEEFAERMYLERITPGGKEIWIRWRMQKKDPQGSKLFRWDLDIDFHVLTLKDVEVMHKGQKFKADKGEVEVTCQANLVIDPEQEWENHWFLKHFKKLVIYRLLKNRLEWHRLNLWEEAYRLQEALKTYLKLETYLPEREGAEFWAKKTME